MSAHDEAIDHYVGQKIRERRKKLQLRHADIAAMLDVSYQQVQRYESGKNTLSIARLVQLAKALDVEPSYFYDGAPAANAKRKPEAEIISRKRERPLRVLLIDDNRSDGVLFRKAAEMSGQPVEMEQVTEPENAMDYLQHHATKYGKSRPDIVLLDVNMPKLNGLVLLKQMKQNSQLSDIPVIMLTSSIRVKEMREAYKYQASGFIQKNMNFEDFAEDIMNILTYWSKTVVLPN